MCVRVADLAARKISVAADDKGHLPEIYEHRMADGGNCGLLSVVIRHAGGVIHRQLFTSGNKLPIPASDGLKTIFRVGITFK